MRRYATLLILFLLTGCSKGILLEEEQRFADNGISYVFLISTTPQGESLTLKHQQAFFLDLSIMDESSQRVKHLTYDLIIRDGEGVEVMRDSRHMMEGAPYRRSITLDKGSYTLEVDLFTGMRKEVTSFHTTSLPLIIS